jgi:KEOPS complex subunit Cgi121
MSMGNNGADYEIRAAIISITDPAVFLDRLRAVMLARGATIICFNAENMAGVGHARAAVDHAIRSFHGSAPVAKTLEMEALLYAAGTRQLTAASAFGIHKGENRAYICCFPQVVGIWKELSQIVRFTDSVSDGLDPSRIPVIQKLFSITDEELEASGGVSRLQDLVIERVALLDAYK